MLYSTNYWNYWNYWKARETDLEQFIDLNANDIRDATNLETASTIKD